MHQQGLLPQQGWQEPEGGGDQELGQRHSKVLRVPTPTHKARADEEVSCHSLRIHEESSYLGQVNILTKIFFENCIFSGKNINKLGGRSFPHKQMKGHPHQLHCEVLKSTNNEKWS